MNRKLADRVRTAVDVIHEAMTQGLLPCAGRGMSDRALFELAAAVARIRDELVVADGERWLRRELQQFNPERRV